MNRRDVLKLAAAAASVEILTPARVFGATQADGSLTYELFFGEGDLKRMRGLFHGDSDFVHLRDQLMAFDRDAERAFMANEVRYNDTLFHIGRLGSGAEKMAFLYLMTGDEDAAELATEFVRTIMKFERWDFFLEGGADVIGVQRAPATTIAVALVVDWLGGKISDEERSRWISTMAQRGCEPCFRSLDGIRNPRDVIGWGFDPSSTFFEHRPGNLTDMSRRPEITQTTNLRAIPASGLTIGAIAYRKQFGENEDVVRWLEMATASLDAFNHIYKPDGSYHEGVSYANYTSLHLAQATSVMERAGEKNPLPEINWSGYIDYVTNMTMATNEDPYDIVNFGDNGNPKSGQHGATTRTAVPYWVAGRFKNSLAQWFAQNMGGAADLWALAWYDPQIKPIEPAKKNRLWISDLDWAVARTGYTADDLVVALRSGGPANHEHADRNALIVKCFGEQLVTDPYRPPYSYSDPAWPMRLTHGHSAVLVDGRGHEHHNGVEGTNASSSYARLISQGNNDTLAYVISSADQPYRLVDLDIKSITRTLIVLYDAPAVVVIDRMTKYSTPSLFQARFFGYNYDGQLTLETSGTDFISRRPGAVMQGRVMSTIPTSTSSGLLTIPDEVANKHPFVEVGTTKASTDALMVTLLQIGRSGQVMPTVAFARTEEGFAIDYESVSLRVSADGSVSGLGS